MDTKKNGHKKTAVLLINNEIVSNALKSVLSGLGYEVSHDTRSCAGADIGFVGSYFAILGILKQIKTINPLLPLVLIVDSDDGEMEAVESTKDLYDVIRLKNHSEVEIKNDILRWFSEGRGKLQVKFKKTMKEEQRG